MERWRGRLGALLALIGGAVGLGNFLRYPFQAAKFGGGAFLVPYLVALGLLALPLVWIEMALGRGASRHGVVSLFGEWGGRRGQLIGALAVYVSLVVGSYYAHLTGWTLGYAVKGALGYFAGQEVEAIQEMWQRFQEREAMWWTVGVFGLMGLAVAFPLQQGIERVNLYAMPLLFLIGLGLALGALWLGETGRCADCSSWAAVRYLYQPRWEALTNPSVWLAAAGQVFFSVGVGFGMYPVYSSYYPPGASIRLEGTKSVIGNTIAEVGLGGLVVVPITAAFLGLGATIRQAGFGLGFAVMPYALQAWGGVLLVVGWYVVLFIAAFTSLLAMALVVRTFLQEVLGLPLMWAAWVGTFCFVLLGVPVFWWGDSVLMLYDTWGGTFLLLVVAFGEWWLFGRAGGRAWHALMEGERRLLSPFWRVMLGYGAPAGLISILVGSFFTPEGGDWVGAFRVLFLEGRWPLGVEALPKSLGHLLTGPGGWVGALALVASLVLVLTLARRART